MKSLSKNGQQTTNYFSRFLFHSYKKYSGKDKLFFENKIYVKESLCMPENGWRRGCAAKSTPGNVHLFYVWLGESIEKKVKRSYTLGVSIDDGGLQKWLQFWREPRGIIIIDPLYSNLLRKLQTKKQKYVTAI